MADTTPEQRLHTPAVEISVRQAEMGDAAILAEIGSSSFRDAYQPHSNADDLDRHIDDYFTPTAVSRAISRNDCQYLLALVSGDPAGIAKYRKAPCPVRGGDSNAIELQQLYVLARMQGHGLGRHLVDRVCAIAAQREAAGVWLSAWEFADWATRFYARNGFTAIGKVQFKLGATSYTDLLMWRPLS